ncbi:MAG: ligand-gated channel [Rhodobacteraceae bacterium]|nr:ligand-gated channel [Paracoccaceae bacterium]MAY45016.1 ligand-gated channel [Paracoccaceae bacterium]QEW19033.1 TonB-dependent heme receptor A precursor [Marinibacterium anthonyi]
MRCIALRTLFASTVSVLALAAVGGPLLAQEAEDVFVNTAEDSEVEESVVGDADYLGEIELGTSKRDIQTQTATAVTTINQEEINDRQAGTVAELIDSVPGVTLVNGSTPQGSGINIRGFGANSTYGTDQKVLVLIDGATTGAEELYRIGNQLFTDPQLYKQVTVNRGTIGSFEYGSGVIGGVVQLETKDASDYTGGEIGYRFRQVLEGSSNGEGFVTSSTLAWQPTEQAEFLLNYTLRDQNNQEDGDGNEIGNSAFRLPSYLIKGKYSFGKDLEHSITASYNDSYSTERDVPYDSFGTTGDMFGNVDRDIHTRVAGLKYEYNPVGNDLVNFSANLTYSDQQIDQSYVPGSSSCDNGGPYPSYVCGFPFYESGFDVVNADQRYETTKLTLKNEAYFVSGALRHDLRAGVELIRKERQDANSAPGGTDDRLAIFAVDDIQYGGFTFTPAIRYETQHLEGTAAHADETQDNDALMGGASLRYEFASGFAVFGSMAYTESLPILDDFDTPLYMTQPEKATTYEGGVSFARGSIFSAGDAVRAKVNVYQTRLWDVTSYSSVGHIEMEGVEMEASYAHSTGIYVDFNANIVDGTETSTAGVDSRWRNAPADSARITLGKRFNEAWDVSWELVGNKGVTDSDGERTPGFGVNNLRTTFRPQAGGIWDDTEIRVSVENILDQEYTPYLSTRAAPGRNFKVSVAKTF